jgi:glycosyltransferase involved in cell wall biosynthesis
LGVPEELPVVGYLGGLDERKGYRTACSAVAEISDAHLLMAGPRSEGHVDADLGPRLHALGMQSDLNDFWASIDVLAVPSTFDPFAVVVTEAAAHGLPSVVTPGVGAAAQLQRAGAGLVREPAEFASGLETVIARRAEFTDGARALASTLASSRQSELLLEHWRARLG